jgi:hypothetical protein
MSLSNSLKNGTLITPPGIVGGSSLFNVYESKLNNESSFFLKLLFDQEAELSPEFKNMEMAVREIGQDHFGKAYDNLVKSGQLRLPFRRDVEGKGWPDFVVCFLNLKSGADFP